MNTNELVLKRKNMRIPVCGHVTTSQAREASTKHEMVTGLPLDTGRFGGISSF